MFCLVPYRPTDFHGRLCWELPPGERSAVCLRNKTQITDPAATGYAIAEYDVLPENAVELDTGNTTRDRDAWESTLGFRPEGETPVDWTYSQLMAGADDTHDDACRPVRCWDPDRLELWLGGRQERVLSYTEKLVQGVLARKVLDETRDGIEAGLYPEGVDRKLLWADSNRLGIPWQTLRPKSARWRGVTPLTPETVYNDAFNSGAETTLAAYGWTTPQHAATFTTGSGYATLKGGLTSGSLFAWFPTALSLPNMQASGIDVTRSGDTNYDIPAGVVCRGNGTDTGYIASHYQASLRIHSSISGALTQLSTTARAGSAPYTLRAYSASSSIKGAQTASSWDLSITNTAITTGLYAGLWVYALGYAGYNTVVQGFSAEDFDQAASSSRPPKGRFGRMFRSQRNT